MDARRAGAIALAVLSVALRACALALCALVATMCFSGLSARLNLVGLIVDVSRALPGAIAGYGVLTTPFGGVFRFDFALVALVLFFLDYACARLSRQLLIKR